MIRRDSESGATMVEFSIAAGFILIVIFSLIEIARYMASMGVLYAAADRAMALAASDYRLLEPEGSEKYNQGVQDVRNRFRDSLAGSWIGLGPDSGATVFLSTDISSMNPKMPDVKESESINEALLNRPVTLEFAAEMKPLIPCLGAIFNQKNGDGCASNIPIRIFSAAFKEPYKALTMPSAVDCRGRAASDPNYNTDCACDVDKYWDTSQGCVCYTGDSNGDGQCDCPGNWAFNVEDKRCTTCTLATSSCSGVGQTFSAASCGCTCVSGVTTDAEGQCTKCINTNQTFQNGSCSCDQASKTACESDSTKQWDDATCSCACKAGLAADTNGSCTLCADPKRKFSNGNCDSCILTSAQCNTQGTGSLDTTTCSCSCHGNLAAACANSGGTYDATNCTCNCGVGGTFNWVAGSAYGSCSCASGMIRKFYPDGTASCECNAQYGLTSNGAGGCKCLAGDDANYYGSYCNCKTTKTCNQVGGGYNGFNSYTCGCICGP